MAFILDDILLSPVNLVVWIGEKLLEAAEAEICDDNKVQSDLLDPSDNAVKLMRLMRQNTLPGETELLHKLDEIARYKEGR